MSTYDWSSVSDPLALQPGTYAVEITASEEKTSGAGNKMWSVTMKALAFGCKLCHDNLMLPPNSGASISKAKLSALGFKDDDLKTVEAEHLLGKRTWVTVKHEEYNGRKSLRVDIAAKGSNAGYWKEAPGDVKSPDAPSGDADTPW